MKVTGIGGFMFRAEDPEALSAWYKKHLGRNSIFWQYVSAVYAEL
jgi:glyoxylase I family protein